MVTVGQRSAVTRFSLWVLTFPSGCAELITYNAAWNPFPSHGTITTAMTNPSCKRIERLLYVSLSNLSEHHHSEIWSIPKICKGSLPSGSLISFRFGEERSLSDPYSSGSMPSTEERSAGTIMIHTLLAIKLLKYFARDHRVGWQADVDVLDLVVLCWSLCLVFEWCCVLPASHVDNGT